MTTSNRLFWNISNIYKATAQSPIFWLLRIIQLFSYCISPKYLSTANRQNISPMEIIPILGYSAEKNCIRTSNRLFGNISTIHIATAKGQFLGYCTSIIFLLRMYLLFICCKSSNYFNTAKRLNIWLPCIGKVYDNFKSPISKYLDDLYSYCAKPNFFLLRNSQLFMYCKSTSYFRNGRRLHKCLLCIEKLYDKFKSPICIEKFYVNF